MKLKWEDYLLRTGMAFSILLNLVATTANTGNVLSSGGRPSSASLHRTILTGQPRSRANESTTNSRMCGCRRDMQT